MLVLGILAITKSKRSSRKEVGFEDDQHSWLPFQSPSTYSNLEEDEAQPSLSSAEMGFPHEAPVSNVHRIASSQLGKLEADNLLCQKSVQQLPKYLVFQSLVECYGKQNAYNEHKLSRRFLINPKTVEHEEIADVESKNVVEAARASRAISRDEAAFHIDYSGPKTHPPKNN